MDNDTHIRSDNETTSPFEKVILRHREITERKGIAFCLEPWEGYYFPDECILHLHFMHAEVAARYRFLICDSNLCVDVVDQLFCSSDGKKVDGARARWFESIFIQKLNGFKNENFLLIVRSVRK